MLLPDKQIIFIALQSRVASGDSISPNSIYITNMRVLFKGPQWLGLKAGVTLPNTVQSASTAARREH